MRWSEAQGVQSGVIGTNLRNRSGRGGLRGVGEVTLCRGDKMESAMGMDCDSTPSKALNPCEAGMHPLPSPSTMCLDSSVPGPCAPTGAWCMPISAG